MNIDWDLPYPSRRSPVFARNVVATSQPLAAEAGLQLLRRGGNAVDAALAAAITLSVVEPTGNGIGSDAFAIVWDGERAHGLNASGRSPAAWSPERFAGRTAMPQHGWESVTVPGAVDAWVRLSERFGRLEFAELFEPALEYAGRGFHVTPVIAQRWRQAQRVFAGVPDFAPFLPNGGAPQPGELFRLDGQARALQLIAETRGESFYRGELAERTVAHARRAEAALTLADLAGHRSSWVDCVSQVYRGVEVHELPPNGQGLATLIALGVLEHFDLGRYPRDSAPAVHLQIEAMKVGQLEAARHVADPDHLDLGVDELLDSARLAAHAAAIDPDRAARPTAGTHPPSGTVYLAAGDAEGMLVSFIQSNCMGFGSGIVVPGTGISLHNRGCGFSLQAGHPNRVAGARRPFHTLMPALATRDGQALLAFGVMGGHMQPQGQLQLLVRVLDHGQNPQAASDAPRWHIDPAAGVTLETGAPTALWNGLAQRGHRFAGAHALAPGLFGGAQLVQRLDDGGYCAASDHRKDGQAVGF